MRLAIERLEDRVLLAASAVQQGTTLVITFTGADADVVVTGGAVGALTVVGLDVAAGPFTGIKNIKIVGEGSANAIDLVDVNITGNVTADLGDGSDNLDFRGAGTNIGGTVKISMREGDDSVSIRGNGAADSLVFAKNVTVDLGAAATVVGDTFVIDTTVDTGETTIQGSLTVKGKDGNQIVEINSTTIEKNLKVDLGTGDDIAALQITSDADREVHVLKSASFKMGDGDDDVQLIVEGGGTVDVDKNLTIDLGNAGALGDCVNIRALVAGDELVTIGGNVSVKGNRGVHDLDLDGFDVDGNVKVSVGNGADTVDISQGGGDINSTIGKSLDLKLDDGDDIVKVERLTVTGKARADGGSGAADEGEITAGGLVTAGSRSSGKNFELPVGLGSLQDALNA